MVFEPKWDGFRCIVFRDGDEIVLGSRNERPLTRYFPELVERAAARCCPPRCVVDGEIVVAGRRRPRLRRAAAAHPPGRVAGQAAERRRPRPRSWPSTCWPSTTATCWTSRCTERRALLDRGARRRPTPPVHLTPATTDRGHGRRLVRPLRGRRARRRDGQAAGRHLRAQQAGAVQGEAPAHRRLRGGRVPHAQGRRRRRLAAARPLRRRRPAAPRRRGVELHRPPPQGAARRAGALPRGRARRAPVAGVGRGRGPGADPAAPSACPARPAAGTPRRT